ncbi:MAG: DUF484 family protein [Formosimonas sp.]
MHELDLLADEQPQALSDSALSSEQVLAYLQTHPEFFAQHAAELAELPLPSANGNVVSMAHWQAQTLRDKANAHQMRLEKLLIQAANNQKTHDKLFGLVMHWLAQNQAAALPTVIERDLKRSFGLDAAKVVVWREATRSVLYPLGLSWLDNLVAHVKSLHKPFCGARAGCAMAHLLDESTASLALIPLWHAHEHECVGVLLLESNDAQRFTADMGTHFLHSIALMAGAALSRVNEVVLPEHLSVKYAD